MTTTTASERYELIFAGFAAPMHLVPAGADYRRGDERALCGRSIAHYGTNQIFHMATPRWALPNNHGRICRRCASAAAS